MGTIRHTSCVTARRDGRTNVLVLQISHRLRIMLRNTLVITMKRAHPPNYASRTWSEDKADYRSNDRQWDSGKPPSARESSFLRYTQIIRGYAPGVFIVTSQAITISQRKTLRPPAEERRKGNTTLMSQLQFIPLTVNRNERGAIALALERTNASANSLYQCKAPTKPNHNL